MTLRKVGIIIGVLGFISSLLLKDWMITALWFIVILQDIELANYEEE
jgi:hypothetical protein